MHVMPKRNFFHIFHYQVDVAIAEFIAIVLEVSKSPTFQIKSSRPRTVLECAKYLQTLSTEAEL